jgi:uncharacterized membrane protein YjjP (DUF1212 family)
MTPPAPPPDAYASHRHRDLEQIAIASLACARMVMESGSRAMTVHECCRLIATGLGVEIMGIRVGYASITVTLKSGGNTITRMLTVRRHGMDHRLNQAIRHLVVAISHSGTPPNEILAQLDALVATSPRYPLGIVVAAVGLACTAFGGLLGVDRLAFLPILLAGGTGQFVRHTLLAFGVNPYVAIITTAFTAAFLCGGLAHLAGSETVNLAAIASTLLLVPGITATNAQADILDGLPTMGSARVVSMLMIMVFITTGIFAAQGVLGLLP